MNQTLRSFAAGAAGALLVTAVVAAQPALATQLDKTAAKNSVTSKSIKNGTIQAKDLNADLNASLAKANSALQSIPDNGVTNPKMADNAVGSAEVAPDSLAAGDLAANSVGSSEIAADSVGASEINGGNLTSDDLTTDHGTLQINFNSLNAGQCQTATIDPSPATGNLSLAGDLITVTPGSTWLDGVVLQVRAGDALGDNIEVNACNVTTAAIDEPNTDFGWGVIEN
jgi:hypothetical protein